MSLKTLSKLEQDAIGSFVSEVKSRFGDNVSSMRLFGSRARGEGTEDSDVDILVVLNRMDSKTKIAIWDIANEIFLGTWINISPLVMSSANFQQLLDRERLIAKDIERDGIPL